MLVIADTELRNFVAYVTLSWHDRVKCQWRNYSENIQKIFGKLGPWQETLLCYWLQIVILKLWMLTFSHFFSHQWTWVSLIFSIKYGLGGTFQNNYFWGVYSKTFPWIQTWLRFCISLLFDSFIETWHIYHYIHHLLNRHLTFILLDLSTPGLGRT